MARSATPTSGASSTRVLVATAAATTCGVLPSFLVGAQAVQVRHDLGLSEAALGATIAAAWGAAGLASSTMGRMAERFGGGRSLRVAATGAAVVQLAVAAGARSAVTLTVLIGLGGVVNALTQPAANVLLARTMPASRLGTAFAVKQSAIPFATLLGGLAVPLLAVTVGWRWSFVAGGLLALAASAIVPTESDATSAEVRSSPPSTTERRPTPTRLGTAPLVVLAGGVGLGAGMAGGMAAFLVSAAVDAGVSESWAGVTLSFGSAIGIASRLAMGRRADRLGGGQLGTITQMLLLGAVAMVAYSSTVGWVYLALAPLAFGAGWAWPGLFNLSVVRLYPDRPGAATGVTQTGTYLGAGGGPLLFGWLVEHGSYQLAWLAAAAQGVLAAGAVLGARTLVRRRRGTVR